MLDWLTDPLSGEIMRRAVAEIVLLGVLSLRTGSRIDWDAANLKAQGAPDADAIIKESYRAGWEVS